MPSHKRGYVHRTQGLQPCDIQLAEQYKLKQQQETVVFDKKIQKYLVESARQISHHIALRVYAVATESTHVHILVSWDDQREWEQIRRSLRGGLSRVLNQQFGKRAWFAKLGSRKRVKEREHFDYLKRRYLSSHKGIKWFENQ
jgi:REP element-mobilizing transposase RayT